MVDFRNNETIKTAVEYVHHKVQGCIAAICHGLLGLTCCTGSNGTGKLLNGKFVAAFSNEEERLLGLDTMVPVLTEQDVDNAGAICVPAQPW